MAFYSNGGNQESVRNQKISRLEPFPFVSVVNVQCGGERPNELNELGDYGKILCSLFYIIIFKVSLTVRNLD